MIKRKITTNLNLHFKLLQLVYDYRSIEAEEVKKFIRDNYSFNANTISTAYRKLCSSGFIEVIIIQDIKFLIFKRDK